MTMIISPRLRHEAPTLGDPANLTLLRDAQISGALAALIRAAKATIFIVQYHFRPRLRPTAEMTRILGELRAAADRGIFVRILLNNPRQDRRFVPRHGALYETLKHPQISIRHHRSDQILHTKLTVIDNYITILGSHNLSEPSLTTSKNISVIINSPPFAEKLLTAYAPIWQASINGYH